MGYEQQNIGNIGSAKSYQTEELVKKETDLESLLNKFDSLNKDSYGIANRLESLSEKLRSEPVSTNPESDGKIPQAGLISRLNILLTDYQRTINRNQESVSRLESII